jgi:hypothetical protein
MSGESIPKFEDIDSLIGKLSDLLAQHFPPDTPSREIGFAIALGTVFGLMQHALTKPLMEMAWLAFETGMKKGVALGAQFDAEENAGSAV